MDARSSLNLALAYHDAWTSGRLDAAAGLIDERVVIEVPINDYSTKASFIDAVGRTRRMMSGVGMLSTLGGTDEAVLIYDMSLPFGEMRVAEHFTLARGRITRLRQIHDTHSLRRAMSAAGEALTDG